MINTIQQGARVQTKRAVLATSVDDELILFDPESGVYFGAGEVGQRIWRIISHGSDLEKIVDVLMNEFDVEKETCKKETLRFLEQLQSKCLIEIKS